MKDCSQCRGSGCVNDVFPVFLKLCDKKVVVVGGGAMAAEKVPALVEAGADVWVVAPNVRQEIERFPVRVIRRGFLADDLDGAWYVVAAAPPDVNRDVKRACQERRLFVNAVDDLKSADVYLGSVIRKAGMTFAISSNGTAPALTALVRRGLERLLPDDLDGWLSIAGELRHRWKSEKIPFHERRPALLRAINDWYQASETPAGPHEEHRA
ncbi:MAG: bifunctional precorrin-2 dehydrogenase/sirohydrochlorin ferrochelatase [Myxococcota bacterium]